MHGDFSFARLDFAAVKDAALSGLVWLDPPARRLEAWTLDEVKTVLDQAHACAREGAWVMGFVRYEAAPALDPALEVPLAEGPSDWPLAGFAIWHTPPQSVQSPGVAASWAQHLSMAKPWVWGDLPSPAALSRDVGRIHEAIVNGEVYQVNLTARLHGSTVGDATGLVERSLVDDCGLYDRMLKSQPQAYGLFLPWGRAGSILSASPELFFDWGGSDGAEVLCRPMKGTAPRDADPQADEDSARRLKASPKERAENLMIVDLLRNDLSRLAQTGSVQVEDLFQVRSWPTVWQMTTDVRAKTRPDLRLSDVFSALFPCGSVTGAPKQMAMKKIAELETESRGVYCGAVGVMLPGGRVIFNVPIRTVVSGEHPRCGIGSGITLDAQSDAEWHEWQVKRGFLDQASGSWALLETLGLRLEGGQCHMPTLDQHLERMQAAARHFWGAPVQDLSARCLQAAQQWRERLPQASSLPGEVAHDLKATALKYRVRITVDAQGHLDWQAQPMPDAGGAPEAPWNWVLATRPMPDRLRDFIFHKTTWRPHYSVWETLAQDRGVQEVLLFNEQGQCTEFTRGNLAYRWEGQWYTPPVHCGLLPGIGRQNALSAGQLRERVLPLEELKAVEALAFINDLRAWVPVSTQAALG